jgi:hypothetical protein
MLFLKEKFKISLDFFLVINPYDGTFDVELPRPHVPIHILDIFFDNFFSKYFILIYYINILDD